ncbi:hypothetical protein PMKS-000171 [Pichia membranifaciens]|uniref:Uncharacterized protein n=1 Tax=Pichia membranifaciens TaxID=4926 RepID=A0A1Q2YAY6_9ASCO|nr:hypothetical protein PMKS-000171 [Pichia membranifaciens]
MSSPQDRQQVSHIDFFDSDDPGSATVGNVNSNNNNSSNFNEGSNGISNHTHDDYDHDIGHSNSTDEVGGANSSHDNNGQTGISNFADGSASNHPGSNSKLRNPTVLVGHGISHNGGVPINNLSKIPSYQWGFKHEDLSSLSSSKYILNALGSRDSCSISSLAGNMPNINSSGLNSRMVRLPIKNDTSSNLNYYDSHNGLKLSGDTIQGGAERSLMNGLPYYNIEMAEQLIRKLNLNKKLGFKASNTNTSWFSDSMNETIDDIEYLHGEVILNQFVNNKRVIRNYQWLLYWNEKLGNKKLIDSLRNKNENVMSYTTYEKLKILRNKKFRELQQKRSMIRQDMVKLDTAKEEKRNEYRVKFGAVPDNLDFLVNGEKSKIAKEIYGEELLRREDELIEKENAIPEYEEELEISPSELEEAAVKEKEEAAEDSAATATSKLIPSSRFGGDSEFNKEQEIVLEKQFAIDDPKLLAIQNKLYGVHKSMRLQNEAKNKSGIITSKVVKIKRKPNPNALGFSNIRSCKPSFV